MKELTLPGSRDGGLIHESVSQSGVLTDVVVKPLNNNKKKKTYIFIQRLWSESQQNVHPSLLMFSCSLLVITDTYNYNLI